MISEAVPQFEASSCSCMRLWLGFPCLQSCVAVCLLSYPDCSTVGRQPEQRLAVTVNNIKHRGHCVRASQTTHVQEGSVDIIRRTSVGLRRPESGVGRGAQGASLSGVWTKQGPSGRVSTTCISTASQEARCKDYCRRLAVSVVTVGEKQASILCTR